MGCGRGTATCAGRELPSVVSLRTKPSSTNIRFSKSALLAHAAGRTHAQAMPPCSPAGLHQTWDSAGPARRATVFVAAVGGSNRGKGVVCRAGVQARCTGGSHPRAAGGRVAGAGVPAHRRRLACAALPAARRQGNRAGHKLLCCAVTHTHDSLTPWNWALRAAGTKSPSWKLLQRQPAAPRSNKSSTLAETVAAMRPQLAAAVWPDRQGRFGVQGIRAVCN